MQAYNKSELENYFLAEEAKKLYQKKFLSKEQLQMIIAQLVQLKSNPNTTVTPNEELSPQTSVTITL